MRKKAFTAEELALLGAARDNPADRASLLVYADWLEERGRGGPAEFLRLRASLPPLLRDGDADAEHRELARQLQGRAKLRAMREALDPAWLSDGAGTEGSKAGGGRDTPSGGRRR